MPDILVSVKSSRPWFSLNLLCYLYTCDHVLLLPKAYHMIKLNTDYGTVVFFWPAKPCKVSIVKDLKLGLCIIDLSFAK